MYSLKILALAAVFACAASAQTATPATPAAAEKPPAKAPSAAQPDSEPVITIEHLCRTPKPGAACKTVITKGEFEKMLNSVRPNLPPAARMQIAQKYVELLTFADKGEQAGLENTPQFREEVKLMKMQALAGAYNRHLLETKAKVTDAETEKYYKENLPAYEEVTLKRIYLPKPSATGEKKPPLDEAGTKDLAEKLQARAAAGEDFDKLEQEAYAAINPAGAKNAPSTEVGPRRRGQLPKTQESAIFDLGAGKVTPVLEEPSGFFIYKVVTKETVPLDKVKPQIERQLEEQKMRDAVQETLGSVKTTFNDAYFNVPAGPQALPGVPGPKDKPAESTPKPPAASKPQSKE